MKSTAMQRSPSGATSRTRRVLLILAILCVSALPANPDSSSCALRRIDRDLNALKAVLEDWPATVTGQELATEQLQLLPSLQRALSAARLLVETRGIGLITGKAGAGKSCLLRLLAAQLPPGLYKTFYLCHTSVGIVEFYTHLSCLFGLEPCYRRAAMFRDLKEHILAMNTTSHLHPILLVDEAHLLSGDILAEIRLLTNFHIDSMNALTVILCGADSLSRKLGLSPLEALANSITITIAVDILPAEESASYIESRLSACGVESPPVHQKTHWPSSIRPPTGSCAPSALSPTRRC